MNILQNVVLVHLDGVPDSIGYYFDENSFIHMNGKIEVVEGHNGWPVGRMKTGSVLGKTLSIDIELFSEMSEHTKSLKPTFRGKILKLNGNYIAEAELRSVELSPFNADNRIPTLGSYTQSAELFINQSLHVSMTEKICTCRSMLFGHEDGCAWQK